VVRRSSSDDGNTAVGTAVGTMVGTDGDAAVERFFVATPAQEKFFAALADSRYRIFALGGAIRGTKTYAVLAAVILLARIYPRSRWAIVRQDLPTIRRTVLPSFEKLRPRSFVGDLLQSTWTYPCANGSEIILFPESVSGDPFHNRWRGLEVNGFVLEEANELVEASYHKAIERAGTWIIPPTAEQRMAGERPVQPPPYIFLTFNPDDGYVRSEFYDPYHAGTLAPPKFFLPLTPKDNPYVTEEQWAIWRKLPAPIYKRFVEGDWGAIVEPNQLIHYEWIQQAMDVAPAPGAIREALDVARYGDDASVFALMDGNTLDEMEVIESLDLHTLSVRAQARLVFGTVDADEYRIDAVGLGAGVVDNMRAAGFNVREFVAGAKPVVRKTPAVIRDVRRADGSVMPLRAGSMFKFANLRSQAWWEFAEKLRDGKIRIAIGDRDVLSRLIRDLTAVRYEVRGDLTIQIESKDDIKKRIGRSTDYGDAAVMAAFELPAVPRGTPVAPSTSRRTFR
jgi:hypothetical protein